MSLQDKGFFISDGDTVRGRSTRNGSAGMFVQSKKFVEEHGGRLGNIAVYGQESNSTTRRLAMMNLAIRGFEGDLGPLSAHTSAATCTKLQGR